ncbi:MAG: ATP-binding protein, partial [Sediminibacterium sp.]|nr:ATP-binding protein [Sediminibacterium sp.]
FAVLFLPRQFQISVVENIHEDHLKKAIWLFPLYLFIINIFVLPIAMAGVVVFKNTPVNADTFLLALPIYFKNTWLTLLVYIGGFSAASSMIIVETIALATMISNNIITPLFFSFSSNKENLNINFGNRLKLYRRVSIICIILLSYLFEIFIAEKLSLVSIGLISFAAVAQFAPAMLGGIYWKNATKNGALIGIIAGFVIWFYTLILPALISAGYIEKSFLMNGPMHIAWLKPTALFGLENIEFISHGFFWSVLINVFCYVGFSVFSNRNPQEIYQAAIFVDIFKAPNLSDNTQFVWNRTADLHTLKKITANFLGNARTKQILIGYSKKFNLDLNNLQIAPPHLIQFIERLLSGHIGSAAAKIMITKIVSEKELSTEEVLQIIKETQQIKASNIELKKESVVLNKLTDELKSVNFQLKKMDEIKDEFLYTVTHEIRTPLTSIRALSEIMQDNPDLSEDEKSTYLNAIVKETERLTHLITQVLNLERYESGRHKLNMGNVDIEEQFIEIINTTDSFRKEKKIQIQLAIPSLPNIYADVDLLKQVFYNLITNAIKFAKYTIQISVILESNNLTIQISDDGIGIDESVHQLIFDKFFQANNQTLKKPEGSGLGLAICKKIIELHQGKIWVQSKLGFGATFFISLPNCIKLNGVKNE